MSTIVFLFTNTSTTAKETERMIEILKIFQKKRGCKSTNIRRTTQRNMNHRWLVLLGSKERCLVIENSPLILRRRPHTILDHTKCQSMSLLKLRNLHANAKASLVSRIGSRRCIAKRRGS